jgi:Ca-activated chloride channel family protein
MLGFCRPAAAAGRLAPALLGAFLALSTASIAQELEPPGGKDEHLTEVATVRLVLLPTSVTTGRGKPVRGLEAGDFRLTDAGSPRDIAFLATEEDLPIAVAFLLDVSGSMGLGDRLDRAKGAIRAFVDELGPDDTFGLIGFADDQVTWITEFTSDRDRFLRRLDVQEGAGRTALYDALAASPGLVADEIEGRKAIVLITDGLDNASGLPMLKAVWIARQVRVPIYTLNFLPMREKLLPRRVRDSVRLLDRFSTETGGSLFPVYASDELARAVARIQEELRFQYVLGFHPGAGEDDGRFRPIRLETWKKGLDVRTRRGYYAAP